MRRYFFLLFLLIAISGCGSKKEGKANGQNNEKMTSDIQTVQVKEVMEIGGWDAPLAESFYRISDVEVDKWGNIYVADMGNIRIQKFSPKGKLLKSINKRGRGPGELGMFFYIELDDDANIYVADTNNGRIQKFTSNCEYINSLNFPISDFNDFEIMKGNIYFRKIYSENNLLFESNLTLDNVKSIIPLEPEIKNEFKGVGGTSISFTVTPERIFIFFNNKTKKFYVFNIDGRLIKSFKVKNKKLLDDYYQTEERKREKEKQIKSRIKIVSSGYGSPMFPSISFFSNNIFAMYSKVIFHKKSWERESILYVIDFAGTFLTKYIGFENSYHTFTIDQNYFIYAIDFDEAKVIKYRIIKKVEQ